MTRFQSSPTPSDLLAYLGFNGRRYTLRKTHIEYYDGAGIATDAPAEVVAHWRRLGGCEVRKPRVLVACEYSGIVRDAFAAKGWDAISCDLLPTERPGQHYQGDVFDIIDNGFDLMIAHPPCTYLCNSGVCWLHKREGRWDLMREGAEFFKRLLNANIPRIAVENPIMHKYAKEIIGVNQSQVIQPWMFGHGETKATCLWLKGLPLLRPTNIVEGRVQRLHFLPPSPDRAKERSRTYQGIADAFAEQWLPDAQSITFPRQLSLFADAA